jgi:hypothetical protein
MRRFALTLGCLACMLLNASPAAADVSAGDMQIMARALSFMARPPSGLIEVGIVYSPDDAESSRDAKSAQELLAGGLRVGSVTLNPVLVPASQVASARVGLLFLTAGLGERARPAAAASREHRIPCITTDLTQVRSGFCAIGIRSQPRVEILVNRAAATADGTSFSTVFSLMITEL